MDWEEVGLWWLAESIKVFLLEPVGKTGQKYAFACFALGCGLSLAEMREFLFDWELSNRNEEQED